MFAHNITITPVHRKVTLRCNGEVIAESAQAYKLHEPPLLPVYYLPRDDVNMALLKPSRHKTACPFKGEARYFDLEIGDDYYENAAWSYETPKEEVSEIKGFIAFYDSVAAVAES